MDSELTDGTEESGGFRVRLRNFEGPFDLLLTLISQRRLDVTEVALHQVTDDFIAYTRALSADLDTRTTGAGNVLDQITEFLVVAATLLDLKAAKLLPAGEVEDAEDLALLEARDLLFARLLQYRAFKQIAQLFAELESAALRRYPRAVALEERYVGLLPEVLLGVDAAAFADIAAAALAPRPVPTVGLDHLHASPVSVPEQAAIILDLLRQRGEGAWAGFGDLVAGCEETVQIVARFLALLELYRQRAVAFEQLEPLGDLLVSWTGEGGDDGRILVSSEDYG
ncbi:Chromosome segregation and condensation protein scpa [Rhodococcus sp. RD6.2]|uniref:segregation and condensation protein A n=1 Tax=Rhodococcus sp. RD6.2 TaxID=260936 RepID=UPI00063B7B5A|nr:segregation/condensation protein A [Rhodococcus sp. RD6.2]CRK51323.1 Chromosome segregation and condensation protein scpa [Rhodococcus sp. RD6.2]